MVYDFLVIGSGCTGIQAARTLVDAGAKVGLIDVGEKDEKYAALIPDRDFLSSPSEKTCAPSPQAAPSPPRAMLCTGENSSLRNGA